MGKGGTIGESQARGGEEERLEGSFFGDDIGNSLIVMMMMMIAFYTIMHVCVGDGRLIGARVCLLECGWV